MSIARLVVVFSLLTVGCPDRGSGAKPEPKRECSHREEKCQLPSGVLGVCNDSECPAGKSPPCFTCIGQH